MEREGITGKGVSGKVRSQQGEMEEEKWRVGRNGGKVNNWGKQKKIKAGE